MRERVWEMRSRIWVASVGSAAGRSLGRMGSLRFTQWLVLVLAVPLGLVTLLRLSGIDGGFPFAAVMTVFPWLVVLGLLPLLGAAVLKWRGGLVISGVTLLVGLALLAPRVLPSRQPSADGPIVTVAVANLRMGLADPDAIVALVDDHEIDVLVLPELTQSAIDDLAAAGLDDRLAPVTLTPSRITSGIGLWSSWAGEVVTARTGRRDTAEVALTMGDATINVSAIHPLPPINARWTDDWRATLEALPDADDDLLRILVGDFNATLDHAALRDILGRGYTDAAAARGQGWRTTFNGLPEREPVPPVTIDHVLADTRIAIRDVTVANLPGSDHRALIVRLQLP